MNDKYPLRILVNDGLAQHFKVTTSISKIDQASQNIRTELAFLEHDYHILVMTVKECLAVNSSESRIDPWIMWLVGDYITGFLDRLDDIGFYLVRQNATLGRDMGLSPLSIKKVISFRKRNLKICMVDPTILWEAHRSSKPPRRNGSK